MPLFILFFSFQSAAELLFCQPDIACYAKLMTGGIIPLAVTLATNDVFESFVGDSKVNNDLIVSFFLNVEKKNNVLCF